VGGNPTAVCSYVIGGFEEDGARLFLNVDNGRIRGNGHKLESGKF